MRARSVAENFPTRARTTGFALVDGVGQLGGGIGVLLIAPHLESWGALTSFLVIAGCLAVAAVITSVRHSHPAPEAGGSFAMMCRR